MRAIAAIFLSLVLASTTSADEVDISGTWNFAAKLRIPCEFTGKVRLSPSPDTTRTDFTCEMTARQYCPDLNIDYTVRQSCRVRNTRGQVWVQATIEEFLKGEDTGSYYPDNFNLSVHSENEMIGALISAGNSSPAIWTRSDGSIS